MCKKVCFCLQKQTFLSLYVRFVDVPLNNLYLRLARFLVKLGKNIIRDCGYRPQRHRLPL